MAKNKFIIDDPNELIVNGSHKKVILYALLFSVPCLGFLTQTLDNLKSFYLENLFVSVLLTSLLYGLAIYFWFMVFDKRIKLIINKNGIWTSKTSLVSWNSLWYYHMKEDFVKGEKYHLFFFKIKNSDIDYKVDITFCNKTYVEIINAIKSNSTDYSIIDLGFETNR
jgi:hypothetical protein